MNTRILKFIAEKESSGELPRGAGIAISVLKDEDVLFSGTYGFRERDRNLPVTPETLFEIGSPTKAFTSAALLMASEEGKVDLSRPINSLKNLLTFNDAAISQDVTITDILSHRTGLPSYDLLWYFSSLQGQELLQRIRHLEVLPRAFRQTFIYNNLMYGALGHLFDEIIGESWESYITRKILTPLKLDSISFRATPDEQNVALPYIDTRRARSIDIRAVAAAGAIRSNLEDMTRWMSFLLNGGKTPTGEQILSEASIDLMLSKQISIENTNSPLFLGLEWLAQDSKCGYGLGWFTSSTKGLKVVFHPGFIDGFSTALLMIPEKRIGFIVLANINFSPIPGLLIQDLLNHLLNQLLSPNEADIQTEEQITSHPERDLSVIGKYENPAFGTLSIALQKNQLVLDYNGNLWPLVWESENSADFVITAFGIQIPLSVQFEMRDGKVHRLSTPLSLDPQLKPILFERLS